MTTEDHFQAMLDLNPDDHDTRKIFADWLDERGDVRGPGYRALGLMRKNSQRFAGSRYQWTWWKALGGDSPSELPDEWFDELRDEEEGDEVLRDYASRRKAEDAAAIAFAKLPAERQAELLAVPAEALR
jgi:uncharacterized protein (TIGR02996 family)